MPSNLATGTPRSVITISSPSRARPSHSLRWARNSVTATSIPLSYTLTIINLYRDPSAEAAQERVGSRLAGDPDPGVHGEGSVGPGDHRVEVEFSDLRQVIGQPGDAQQDVGECGQVGRGGAAVAEQQRGGPDR